MNLADSLRQALRGNLSAISIESLIQRHVSAPAATVADLPKSTREELAERVASSVRLFSASEPGLLRTRIRVALGLDEGFQDSGAAGGLRSQVVSVRGELDVSVARNEARSLTLAQGGSGMLAVKVATAVSELARNIVLYAGTGSVAIEVQTEAAGLVVRIVARDDGPGIAPSQLEAMFAGSYRSRSGLGKGLLGVKRVASDFKINTALGKGTIVHAVFRGNS
ncbi:MAG: ATP-binding protein [Myxococcales bacterium]